MSDYLVIKGKNNNTRSYSLNTTYSYKPYLKVSNGYLDLTTETGTNVALNVKEGNKTYRPVQSSSSFTSKEYNTSSTYTSSDSYHTTTRVSNYTGSYKAATSTYYGKQTITTAYMTRYTSLYQTATYSVSSCGDNAAGPCKSSATAAATMWVMNILGGDVERLSNIQGSTVMSYIGTADKYGNAGARGHASYLLPRYVTSATVNYTSYYYAPVHSYDVAVGTVSHKWTGYNSTLQNDVIINTACNANGNSVTEYATATGWARAINGVSLLSTLTKVTNTVTTSAQSNYTRSSGYTDYYYTQTSNYTSSSSTSASTTIV